jgi:hypothetical protein
MGLSGWKIRKGVGADRRAISAVPPVGRKAASAFLPSRCLSAFPLPVSLPAACQPSRCLSAFPLGGPRD